VGGPGARGGRRSNAAPSSWLSIAQPAGSFSRESPPRAGAAFAMARIKAFPMEIPKILTHKGGSSSTGSSAAWSQGFVPALSDPRLRTPRGPASDAPKPMGSARACLAAARKVLRSPPSSAEKILSEGSSSVDGSPLTGFPRPHSEGPTPTGARPYPPSCVSEDAAQPCGTRKSTACSRGGLEIWIG
jgi:hypothetical protein